MTITQTYSDGSDSPVAITSTPATLATLNPSPAIDLLVIALHWLTAPGASAASIEVTYGGQTCERVNSYSTYKDLIPSAYGTRVSLHMLRAPPTGARDLKASQIYGGSVDVWWSVAGFVGADGYRPSGLSSYEVGTTQAGYNENLALWVDVPPRGAAVSCFGAYYNITSLAFSETEINRFDNNRLALGWEPPTGDGTFNWSSNDASTTAVAWALLPPVIFGEIEPALAATYNSTQNSVGTAGVSTTPGAYIAAIAYAYADGGECYVTAATYDGRAMTKVGTTITQTGCAGLLASWTVALEIFAVKDPVWSGASPVLAYAFSTTPHVKAAVFVGFSAVSIADDIIEAFNSSTGTAGTGKTLTTDKDPGSGLFGFATAFYGGELGLSGQDDSGIMIYGVDTKSLGGGFPPEGDILFLVGCFKRPQTGNSTSFQWTDIPGAASSVTACMGIAQQLPTRGRRILKAQT